MHIVKEETNNEWRNLNSVWKAGDGLLKGELRTMKCDSIQVTAGCEV